MKVVFAASTTGLIIKSKDRLAQNQDNVNNWSNMSTVHMDRSFS